MATLWEPRRARWTVCACSRSSASSTAAPPLGQDADAILRQLGLDDPEIARLRADKVVA